MRQRLTKSRFIDGWYCPTLLWYKTHDPDALPSPSTTDLARMQQGTEVGLLAQKCFPGGIATRGASAIVLTQKLLGRPTPIFEAAFQTERLMCKVDILTPSENGYDLIEVKSSTRVKDEHIIDVAFQAYVLEQAGVRTERIIICHINREYVRHGDLDIQTLFSQQDVTEQAFALFGEIPERIQSMLKTINGPRPEIGDYHLCSHPHSCPITSLTTLPAHNVTELYRTNGAEHLKNGTRTITELDPNHLNRRQAIQRETIMSGKPYVEREALKRWLDALRYPIVHLDFETMHPAIPVFEGTRPYEHIPFQFSAHIEYADGRVEHREFLAEPHEDPRSELCSHLAELPVSGTILAHYANFEKSCLKSLRDHCPEHAEWLEKAHDVVVDLIVPFRNFWYYHPEQHGSCSIKYILPALTGTSYEDLTISDGETAGLEFSRMRNVPREEHAAIRRRLIEYCTLDTKGMVEILRVLRESCA